ncbi:Ribosomal-protein-alanine N-acetyltransferase [Sorangium cellulosum So ce56]|uniref:Ribosomal-protein-alanine N-acetyltransferase n=1 Tax=Sorangium cellulosum (strain So ce56) TaxID=448385 RepID=A9ESV5_SORC5|nr:ribosomal protein S18-alanine N-acetyltransferase [Sorangium cellulosum]CAN97422.1 Ribosomal-protein-alanine N-acetyltransferase [Sorangium cellulosum So ce56]
MKRDATRPSVSLSQLTADAADDAALDEIDAVASAAFDVPQFSAREELRRPWTRCWVAREERRALAFLIAWHVADELHVLNVATCPAARRRGLATALMNRSLEYAQQQQVRLILLEVRRSNRAAIRLYRKLGFTAMGVRPRYYSDNGEDAVEMVLTLDPATGAVQPGRDEIRIEI